MAIHTVTPAQNYFDISMQRYGSIEGLFDLLISNPERSMVDDLEYAETLQYHDEFIINSEIKAELEKQGVVPANGCRHVYFKRPEEELIMIVCVENADLDASRFIASGKGTMIIDWGDNSELEYVTLGTNAQSVEHYFDNSTDKRRIKIYGNNETLKLIVFNPSEIGGTLILCRPLVVDEYICHNQLYLLSGLALFEGTYRVSINGGFVSSLLPIADMSLQQLDLTNIDFATSNVIDDYLEYIATHYGDRCPCTVHLTDEPSARGYAAIDMILAEEEWNVPDTWKFYINNQLYLPNESDTE